MGYTDKLQKLCVLRGLDQVTLARSVGVSKSSMSRILNGTQEPKLLLAYEIAKTLGVSLDSLVNEEAPLEPSAKVLPLSEDQLTILSIVERLGYETAIDRLLAVPTSGIAGLHAGATSESHETERLTAQIPVVGILSSGRSRNS